MVPMSKVYIHEITKKYIFVIEQGKNVGKYY